MRVFSVPVIIAFVVCGATEMMHLTVSASDSTRQLNWAPLHLKSPYLTFLNNFYFPSWRTRHPMTKGEESLRDLELPRGVPFAVVCGACFKRSWLQTNLTVSASGHEYRSVPKLYSERQAEYPVGDFECLMTYMITAPIERDGSITCTLNRGTRRRTETITFHAARVSIDDTPEELEIKNEKGPVRLRCPLPEEAPALDNPLVHVWHEEHGDPNRETPIATMRSTISLEKLKYTRHIVCSVYGIGRPEKVYRARYRVMGSRAMAQQEYHVAGDHDVSQVDDVLEGEEDDGSPREKGRLSSSVVGIIVTVVIVCVLLSVLGLYRFVSAAARR